MSDNSSLSLDITHNFDGFKLSVREDIPLDGITAIFGDSGSGKSTLLRMIAGFETPQSAIIKLSGQIWVNTQHKVHEPPHKRSVGYVHQGGHLLPHLDVTGNLVYADNRSDHSKFAIGDVVAALDIAPLLHRKIANLSGGEKQRVALAQALLTRPDILLLDEPLSALDQKRKRQILPVLEKLPVQFGIPILYVSHDISEVSRLADRVLVLEHGKVVGKGDVAQTLNQYAFTGATGNKTGAILSGMVSGIREEYALAEVTIGNDKLWLSVEDSSLLDRKVRIIIHSNEVAISTEPPSGLSIQNSLKGEVNAIHPHQKGAMVDLEIKTAGNLLPVQITKAAVEYLQLKPGSDVYALIKTAILAR